MKLDYTAHFSENWGYVSLAPMIGGNVFSIAFGRNLDAHAPSDTELQSRVLSSALALLGMRDDKSHQCLQGSECYVDSLMLTIAACSLALFLGIYAGWKDFRAIRRYISRGRAPAVEVVWEVTDD